MSAYKVFYSPHYYADIGEGHVFPIRKFELVRDKLLGEGIIAEKDILEPPLASTEDLLLVHTTDYIERLVGGSLTAKEIRKLGLPWSHSLVRRSFHAISGTIEAARSALSGAVASNLAGGTHHAFRPWRWIAYSCTAVAEDPFSRRLAERFLIIDSCAPGKRTAFIFQVAGGVHVPIHGAKTTRFSSTLDPGIERLTDFDNNTSNA